MTRIPPGPPFRYGWLVGGLLCAAAHLSPARELPRQSPPESQNRPAAAAEARDTTFAVDYLDTLVAADAKSVRLTLPNGRTVVGVADSVKRDDANHVSSLSGTIQHPEAGDFSFQRSTGRDGAVSLSGMLRFTGGTTVWNIRPSPKSGRFGFEAAPAADAFRPRRMELPARIPKGAATPAAARDAAEEQLRKSLHIEQPAPGRLRIGGVEILKDARVVTFPATMNQREGVVEYAVVTRSGKSHESLFTTPVSPKDVHLALLLLGVKPAPCPPAAQQSPDVPAAAAARITVEWTLDGTAQSRDLSELVTVAGSGSSTPSKPLAVPLWQCNGSRFNRAGFAAELEGSVVSLIADDLALINNPGADRSNDDSHFANTASLPPAGTPVTIRIAPPPPASITEKPNDTP